MKKFFQNTTYSLMGKIVGAVALVLLDIMIARALDVESYAEWVYFFSLITMLFYIGWLGINASTKVIISQFHNDEDRKKCLTGSFILRIVASVVICFFLMAILFMVANKLGYPEKYPSLQRLIMYSGLLIFLNSMTEYYKEVFMGYEKFYRLFQLTVLEYVGYLLFAFMLLNISDSVEMVAGAYCIAGTFVFIFGLYFLRNECGLFCIDKVKLSILKPYITEIIRYAIPMLLVGMGVVILIEIDTFMLGILSNKNEVAIYNIAKSLNSKAAHVNYSIAVGGMTTFGNILDSEYKAKRKQFIKLSMVNIIFTTVIAFFIFFASSLLINFFYGETYSAAGKVTQLLVLYYILYSVSTFYSTFMDFRRQAKKRAIMYIIIIVIDIFMNIILIPQYGAMGASAATMISMLPYTGMTIIVTKREWMQLKIKGDKVNGNELA